MISDENNQYLELEKNLNKILNKGKAQMEAERLKMKKKIKKKNLIRMNLFINYKVK